MTFEIPGKITFKQPVAGRVYDTIIIGAGPAGMTATVYCLRKKMDLLLITKDIGGQVLWTSEIRNYMGYMYISGKDLSDKFYSQIAQFPASVLNYTEVTALETDGRIFTASCKDGKYLSRTVIIASGRIPRRLGVPGENNLVGKGVAYCSICDAPVFADMPVAVVGGGNSALTAVLDLVQYASEIHLVHALPEVQGDPVLYEKVKASSRVREHLSTDVLNINGEKTVEGISVLDKVSNKTYEIPLEGVFVEIGLMPNTKFLNGLVHANKTGEILIDCNACTSMKGIFACGDVTAVEYKQIIVACGEGAKAALSAHKHLLETK